MSKPQHVPVLLDEFLSFFEGCEIESFIDGTLGAGGHAEAILAAHPEIKRFYGFDQDESAMKIAKARLEKFKDKVEYIPTNFCHMSQELKERGESAVDGIFLDVGVSSMQIDQPERGFSFSKEGPLDMRMDRSYSLTAEEIVNTWPEDKLSHILREYGDVPRAGALAKKIIEVRRKKRIRSTKDLSEALSNVVLSKARSLPPMTLIFQALRIAVNNELEVLEHTLPEAVNLLNPGGRFGVISFHSGEDRIVKNCFKAIASNKTESGEPIAQILTKKPIKPTATECRKNRRSKSAKMRFIEKL